MKFPNTLLALIGVSFFTGCQHPSPRGNRSESNHYQMARQISEKRIWDQDGIFAEVKILDAPPASGKIVGNKSDEFIKLYLMPNYQESSYTNFSTAQINGKEIVVNIISFKKFPSAKEAEDFYKTAFMDLVDKFKTGPTMSSQLLETLYPTGDSRGSTASWHFMPRDAWIEGYVKQELSDLPNRFNHPTRSAIWGISDHLSRASISKSGHNNPAGYFVIISYETKAGEEALNRQKEAQKKKSN